MTSSMATHFNHGLCLGNSYAQIGHTVLLESISIAQEGHSIVFFPMGKYTRYQEQ